MQEELKHILGIQDLDMKMLRLMRVKKERQKELQQIHALRKELSQQLIDKESELSQLNQSISQLESKVQDTQARIKKLETQQSSIKKMDEFNAMTHEMAAAEKDKIATEQKISDLIDKRVLEEEMLSKIKESFKTSEESSLILEKEIESSIQLINEEGRWLKQKREEMQTAADPEMLQVYERLLHNKKDRVIVSIENRTCNGCHIALTAQHENQVRKGDHLVFCEHCSRIHFWQEREAAEETSSAKRRRRRAS